MSKQEYSPRELALKNCIPLIGLLVLILVFGINLWAGIIVLILVISIGAGYIYYKKILPKREIPKKKLMKDIFYYHDHAEDIEPNLVKFSQWFKKAQINMEKGNSNLAIKNFKNSLKYHIKNAIAWFNLGILYVKKGMMNKAEKCFFRAQKNAPDNEEYNKHHTRVIKAKLKANKFYKNLQDEPIEKMKLLKCLNCGSREELIPLVFSKTYTRTDSVMAPGTWVKIFKRVDSTILPFCTGCASRYRKSIPPMLASFTRDHKPAVRFKGVGSAISYVDWIAQVFYEIEN
ncbi:MAG: tetratricopeptide repeat protein [Promethearchaeota archaeon]